VILLEPEESDRSSDDGHGAERLDTAIAVRRALADLPSEHQLVLTLCDVEQWDAAEAAFMLEKTVQATKSLLYRARRGLRARLSELWGDEEAMGGDRLT
jgi:RNA polymerase sigma-70 factor, ECF subfamily